VASKAGEAHFGLAIVIGQYQDEILVH